ncbi:hypothetical protein ACFLXQ_05595, partial [Chloroflexota bacterium]
MKLCKLFSAIVIITLLFLGFLVNFVGPAQAAAADLENSTPRALVVQSELALPPGISLDRPLLNNTPVLTITKTAPATVIAGETLTYTVVVANSSITDATGTVITDFLDSNVTFGASDGTYSPGDHTVTWNTAMISGNLTITRTLLITVGANITDSINLSNTVEVTSTEGAGDSDTVNTTVNTEADVSISKNYTPSDIIAGETVTYTMTIVNNGPSDAQTVVVTDTLPVSFTVVTDPFTDTQNGQFLGWNLNTLASGDSETITVSVLVGSDVSGTVDNTATVTTTTTDPTPDNNQTDAITVSTKADLTLIKDDQTDPILNNQNVRYELTVINNGPSDATGIVLTDTLPTNADFSASGTSTDCSEIMSGIVTCDLGIITSVNSKTVIIWVVPHGPGILNNEAEVTAIEPDPIETNNRDTEETTVQLADLSITKSDVNDPVLVGYPLTYTLSVHNYGPNDATNVIITDTLPQNVTFSFVSSALTCNQTGVTVITCSMSFLDNYSDAPPITI